VPRWGLPVFFCGQYNHQLDDKGRLRIPPAFRKLLGDNPVIFRHEKCLQIYKSEDFETRIKSNLENADVFDKEANRRKREIFPSVQTVTEDKQGRVAVNPVFLKDCKMKKSIISIGVLDHVEIWDERMYDAYINDRELPEDDEDEDGKDVKSTPESDDKPNTDDTESD